MGRCRVWLAGSTLISRRDSSSHSPRTDTRSRRKLGCFVDYFEWFRCTLANDAKWFFEECKSPQPKAVSIPLHFLPLSGRWHDGEFYSSKPWQHFHSNFAVSSQYISWLVHGACRIDAVRQPYEVNTVQENRRENAMRVRLSNENRLGTMSFYKNLNDLT